MPRTFGEGTFSSGTFGGGDVSPPGGSAASWTLDLDALDGSGTYLESALTRSLKVVWSLDGPGSCEIDIGADSAAQWIAGQRRVKALLNGTKEWAGWLTALTEGTQSFDDLARPGGTNLRASGLGLAGRLPMRVVHGNFSRTAVVGTTIAWNLIQHAQLQTNGNYGFTLGTITGVANARTRHYCDGDNIADAINELAAKVPGGFDWEIDHNGKFNAWVGGRGASIAESLARTEAMEWSVDYETVDLVTYATALGEADEPCGAPLVTSASGLASTYGRLESVVELDSNDTAELTEAAAEELRSRGAARLRLNATWPENRAPWTFGAVWLGDRIPVTLPAHFGGTQSMRLIEVGVSVEPPELATHEYEFEVYV